MGGEIAPYESVGWSKLLYLAKKNTKLVEFFFFFFFNFIQRKLRLNLKKYSCVDLFLCEVVKLVLS